MSCDNVGQAVAAQETPEGGGAAGFSWSPEGIATRAEFFAALQAMPRQAGFGFPTFASEARKLVRSGRLPGGPGEWPADPLPRSSLNRVMKEEDWGWFRRQPRRLEVYLRVAGCPESEIGAWLDKLSGLREPAEGDELAREHVERPERGRAFRRRTLAALLALAGTGLVYLLVLAAYAQFYNVLGVGLGELPAGHTVILASTFLTVVFLALAVVALGGAFVTGAGLVPMAVTNPMVVPTAAMSTALFLAGWFGLLLAPGVSGGPLTVLAATCASAWLGAMSRLLTRKHTLACFAGLAVGLATMGAVIAVAMTVARWTGSRLWLFAVFATGAVAVLLVIGWWLRRRLPPVESGEISPLVLLTRLRRELLVSVSRDIRPPLTWGEARKVMMTLVVLPVLLLGVGMVGILYLVGGAAQAGYAAREYGYLPSGASPLIWSDSVRPATVTVTGDDPVGVCQRAPALSASLIAQDGDASWVLLRPVRAGAAPAEVVRLPTDGYTVRLVLDAALVEGEPWRRPACGP